MKHFPPVDDVAAGIANAYQLALVRFQPMHQCVQSARKPTRARMDTRLLLFPVAVEVVLESPLVSRCRRALAVRFSVCESRNFDASRRVIAGLCLATLADVVKPLVGFKVAKS